MNKTATLAFLIGALFLFPFIGNSQQKEFAPIGAEWYHYMSWGVYHSTVPNDTVINGITCRHIAVRPQVNWNPGPPVFSKYDFYVYNTDDTVFFYNGYRHRFTPMYVFNVSAGDTVTLPVFPFFSGPSFKAPDSCFQIVIDSVTFELWGTDTLNTLKTVYTHKVGLNVINYPYPVYSFDGPYVEKLGSIAVGFFPYCKNCIKLLSDNYQPIGALRCYHELDSAFSVELVDTCEGRKVGMGIHDRAIGEEAVQVFPNPGWDEINISFQAALFVPESISVFDLQGRRMYSRVLDDSREGIIRIDVSSLPPGLYFLKLKNAAGRVINKKFSKR